MSLIRILLISAVCSQAVSQTCSAPAKYSYASFHPSGSTSSSYPPFHPTGSSSSSYPSFHPSGSSSSSNPSFHPSGSTSSSNPSFHQPGSPFSSKPSFQPNGASLSSQHWGTFWPQSDVYLQPSGIAWSYANDGNKLVHALQGNKRNPGYKYLAWNCGRGFVSERKIDDLKVTLNRHQPHLAGISEVDLYRNENNSDLSANNNFSTEQLHEKLHIKGYNTLGVARVIVFAKDDLKIKHLYPQDECYHHIQNISLEVGFGRSKTHMCNFYYREWTLCKN